MLLRLYVDTILFKAFRALLHELLSTISDLSSISVLEQPIVAVSLLELHTPINSFTTFICTSQSVSAIVRYDIPLNTVQLNRPVVGVLVRVLLTVELCVDVFVVVLVNVAVVVGEEVRDNVNEVVKLVDCVEDTVVVGVEDADVVIVEDRDEVSEVV